MNSGNITITTDDISVTYNNGHKAIYDVSIKLESHTTCALVGVNGSGKSTLFKSIMGLVTPQTGSILIGGMPVQKALKRSQVAYVPQSEDIDWDFPILVRDVVMQGRYGFMGFFRIPSQIDQLAVDNAMERLGIQDLGSRQIGELSGGQKKRVFLARALAQKSKIILLDEPFTGVDVKTENAIMELMQELQDEGYLMLVSTHNLGSVSGYCNEVILLNRTVIASGPTETTYTQENLEKTFGGILKHIHLGGSDLHDDADERKVTIITDDERPAVFYGKTKDDPPVNRVSNASKNNSFAPKNSGASIVTISNSEAINSEAINLERSESEISDSGLSSQPNIKNNKQDNEKDTLQTGKSKSQDDS